jgi:hypothetical protein
VKCNADFITAGSSEFFHYLPPARERSISSRIHFLLKGFFTSQSRKNGYTRYLGASESLRRGQSVARRIREWRPAGKGRRHLGAHVKKYLVRRAIIASVWRNFGPLRFPLTMAHRKLPACLLNLEGSGSRG